MTTRARWWTYVGSHGCLLSFEAATLPPIDGVRKRARYTATDVVDIEISRQQPWHEQLPESKRSALSATCSTRSRMTKRRLSWVKRATQSRSSYRRTSSTVTRVPGHGRRFAESRIGMP